MDKYLPFATFSLDDEIEINNLTCLDIMDSLEKNLNQYPIEYKKILISKFKEIYELILKIDLEVKQDEKKIQNNIFQKNTIRKSKTNRKSKK